ncbi:YihY family inner membrane protein [Desulfobaculum bizertense]|uniref:YhjD/YihY/BrkB family envelope integrity protein n=1 Tax=Desulfobaculum bizertense TaxID=376490 RepID=UPI001F171476|nr:YhjD/YihY/BrkB family envelope integrity protein [Desulfobaculum bizertense]UIJ37769.1 YihY family inner membrane protein [Desulfobaculum bizertense]
MLRLRQYMDDDDQNSERSFAEIQVARLVRWIYMVGHGFIADQCLLRASALAYTTVLSLVPLLAVAFSISKGFGFQDSDFIRSILLRATTGNPEIVDAIVGYINNTNVATLGVIGVSFLLFTVISLLGNIEASFNSIFGIKAQRSIWRKFSDYLTVVLICPLLILVAISATASVQNTGFIQNILSYSVFSTLYIITLKALPFITTWFALLFIYIFIPNTRVRFWPAFGGAFIAGTLWQVTQVLYIKYQVTSSNYNAIYGSFAQVPLFLIWLFISWVIVLLGAEICFALQFSETYYSEARLNDYSFDDRQQLAVLMLALLTHVFMQGKETPDNETIAHRINAPVKLVNDVMYMLAQSRIVQKIDHPGSEAFSLARPPEKVRIVDILRALSHFRAKSGRQPIEMHSKLLSPVFSGLIQAAYESNSNLTLTEFAQKCSFSDFCQDKTEDTQI